jgi:DNA ligase-associated metallophosphoesterase
VRVEFGQETWDLLPEKALYHPESQVVVVADLHLGKAEFFQQSGIPASTTDTAMTLKRLSRLIEHCSPRNLILLGDLWHESRGMTRDAREQFRTWCARFPELGIVLLVGNHDPRHGGCGDIPNLTAAHAHAGPGVTQYQHYPGEVPGKFVIAGHLHPGLSLRGRARQSLTLPCFWITPRYAVLPAFGVFTGKHPITPTPGQDRCYVVAQDEVVAVLE